MASAYGFCLLLCVFVLHHVSEYEYSAVLTLAVFFQALALVLILLQIESTKTVKGISAKSFTLIAGTFALRLVSTIFCDGYLPLDATGDHLYQIADLISLGMAIKVLHSCLVTYRRSLAADEDTVNVKSIAMVCTGLAILIHPDLNDWPLFDIAWTVSLYMETAAMAPQIMLMAKTGKTPSYTAHYVFATLVSRTFSAMFWYHGAQNIIMMDEDGQGSSVAAIMIVLCHLAQFLMLADFGYYYLKGCAKNGIQSSFDTSYDI